MTKDCYNTGQKNGVQVLNMTVIQKYHSISGKNLSSRKNQKSLFFMEKLILTKLLKEGKENGIVMFRQLPGLQITGNRKVIQILDL